MERKEEEEAGVFIGGGGTGNAANSSVAFPIDSEVSSALTKLSQEKKNYVQIIVDTKEQKIILGTVNDLNIDQVASQVPSDEARFHFYNWKHEIDGKFVVKTLFIYSCPDGSSGTKSAPVRQRMLYSSSKSHIIDFATKSGLQIAGKFEINNGAEFNVDIVSFQLYPKPVEQKKAFSKPKAAGRGPRKLN